MCAAGVRDYEGEIFIPCRGAGECEVREMCLGNVPVGGELISFVVTVSGMVYFF